MQTEFHKRDSTLPALSRDRKKILYAFVILQL